MNSKTSYDLSKFLADRAYNQLMKDLKSLSTLLDTMIDDAERNRDMLATALMNEAADEGGIKEDTNTDTCMDCMEEGSWCKCHLKYK